MDTLAQKKLINKKGEEFAAESILKNVDIVCYYFSAHWCPSCRMFTPVLANIYKELKKKGCKMEVIFVSSDRDQKEMLSYMAESHADWMAVPWGSQTSDDLDAKYDVRCLPTMIVVKKNGQIITRDGRSDVYRYGSSCVDQWMRR